MRRLWDQIAQYVRDQIGTQAVTRIALISAYDPDSYAIKALVQPENVETGWFPLGSLWVGPSWGAYFGPILDQQITLLFEQGHWDCPIGIVQLPSVTSPPVPVPSGEAIIQHQTGTKLHFDNAGNLNATTTADLNLTAKGNTNLTVSGGVTMAVTGAVTGSASAWNLTGPLNVTGNIVASGDVSDASGSNGTLGNLRTVYNGHYHYVPASPGNSNGPSATAS